MHYIQLEITIIFPSIYTSQLTFRDVDFLFACIFTAMVSDFQHHLPFIATLRYHKCTRRIFSAEVSTIYLQGDGTVLKLNILHSSFIDP